MFASKTLLEHLARGAIAIGAFVVASLIAPAHPWLALVMVPVALVALRGCPMCWTIGLMQTVLAKVRGRSTEGLCTDGACRLTRDRRIPSRSRHDNPPPQRIAPT